MSIQSEIDRINGNVQDTISTIQQTGVSVPSGANSNNLPSLAAALANTKQDKLTGQQGQVVGFDAEGNAVAQAATASGGKRVCRLVVGTSASGWTSADCDYLCDGTADDVEINAAIQALPSTGGEIVILDGTYNITAEIAMNKDNVKLSGNGAATILKRMWGSSGTQGVITISAPNGGCCVENLCVDGNKETYSNSNNCGIYLNSGENIVKDNICCNSAYGIHLKSERNTVVGNTCNDNGNHGIHLGTGSEDNIVTGNICNNSIYGIRMWGNNNAVTGNNCNSNTSYGIYVDSGYYNTITGNCCNDASYGISVSSNSGAITGNACINNSSCGIRVRGDRNTVAGNVCQRGDGTSDDYTSSQYTINCTGDNNLIVGNIIMGKNYTDSGTGNTWANNKYN